MLILSVLLPLVAGKDCLASETSLLQTSRESTKLLEASDVELISAPGWTFAGLGSCEPTTISSHSSILDIKECATLCAQGVGAPPGSPAATGFSYPMFSQECECCFGVKVESGSNPSRTPFVYVLADPFWSFFETKQRCRGAPAESLSISTLAECASHCEASYQWLVYGPVLNWCSCCNDDGVTEISHGGLGYQLDHVTTFPEVSGWDFKGRRWDCDGAPVGEITTGSPLGCAHYCETRGDAVAAMVIDQNADKEINTKTCKCCTALAPEATPSSGVFAYLRKKPTTTSTVEPTTTSTVAPVAPAGDEKVKEAGTQDQKIAESGPGSPSSSSSSSPASSASPARVVGDPHITALDGSHYLLLSQGTFSLWHLRGLSTEFQAQNGAKKVPVEWEILTHYSGRQSFTKGLLLVDRSAGVQRQVLEITSRDCQWRAHSGAEWNLVSKPGMISVADDQDFVTGFKISKAHSNKHRGRHASRNQLKLNQVHFTMNSQDGATDIAVLSVSCRSKRNLDLNLDMKRRSEHKFVEGELAERKKLATLQTSDSEFSIKGRWQELGGTDEGAAYLRQMDEDSTGKSLSLLQSCNAEEKVEATRTCSKYLDSLGELDRSGFFFNDCVYDVCHGAGEVTAELAAELLESI